jgi:NAD(P)-dependent dehydrogenase (short-subunit alcohol dehydrogenase family)
MGRLDGKVSLVTGSSSGIGRAIARGLAAEGSAVVLAARRAERLKELAEEIAAGGGTALPVPTDVSSELEVERLFQATRERFGRLDVLVNNAGTIARGAVDELPVAAWDEVMAVNLRGPFLCSQQAMRIMKEQRSGRIINIGSLSAQRVRPNNVAYNMSKFGLDGLTHSVALEGRPFGITCGSLHPGNTKSEFGGQTQGPPPPPGTTSEPRVETEEMIQAAIFMATAPPHLNVFQMIVLPIDQPYIGRG